MKANCKNCDHVVDFENDTECKGCHEKGFKVIFSKEDLEDAQELSKITIVDKKYGLELYD